MTEPLSVDPALAPGPVPQSPLRRWGVPLLKFSIAAGLIYYVYSRELIDFKRLQKLMETPQALLLAIVVFSGQLLSGAQRLRILLIPQGVKMSYLTTLRLTYIGAGFDVFSFSSVGGDAVKALYLARHAPAGRRTEVLSVMLLDRLMGLFGLLTITLVVSLWQLESLWNDEQIRPYLLGMGGISLFLLAGTSALLSQNIHAWFSRQAWFKKIPLSSFVERVYGALQLYRNFPQALLLAWLLSVVVHTLGVTSGYILMRALELNAPLGVFMVAWLLSNFVSSFLPAGGIGSGQSAYNVVFQRIAGIGGGADLATAFQITFIVAKAPGLIIWLLSRETVQAVTPKEGINV